MAGLLDALFDPSLYSGAGGLLSRLSPSLGTLPQSGGFGPENPIAIGGYQMPRIGDPAQFASQADPAALPPNAQPTQGQMPQTPQMPAFGPQGEGAFTTGLRALGNQGGAINKIADAVQGFTTGQTPTQRQQSQLFQAYVGAGLTPQQAYVAVLNPQLAGNLMGGGTTDDIKEYQFARKENPGLTFEKFMQQKKAVSGEYSLTPQYGTDEKGNTVLIQTGKSGEAIQTKLPAGVKISSGVDKIDLGTSWGIVDKRTGQLIGQQPKDVAGKESAEKVGQARGTAQAALANGADIDAEQTKKKIDDLLKSEGLDAIVGPVDQYRPSWTLGKSGRDALARLEQLQGGAFLQAFSTLKGGGAITEVEGQKAEKAIARMQRSQSEDDFKSALKDFRDAIDIGLQKLRRAAAGGEAPQSAPAATTNLKAKYGLD